MLEIEKKALIKAMHLLNYKATVADVVTQTGISQDVVQRLLNQIAAETGGRLSVSGTGDIFYQLPTNFEKIFEINSLSYAINAFSAESIGSPLSLFSNFIWIGADRFSDNNRFDNFPFRYLLSRNGRLEQSKR